MSDDASSMFVVVDNGEVRAIYDNEKMAIRDYTVSKPYISNGYVAKVESWNQIKNKQNVIKIISSSDV